MNIPRTLLAGILLALPLLACSQVTHTFHHTYDLREVQEVQLNLAGDLHFVKWQGKQIMLETKIELSNATQGMLRFLIKRKKRYEILDSGQSGILSLESHDKERKALITQEGHCDEVVTVTIHVPNDFDIQGEHLLVRSESAVGAPIVGEE